MIRNSFLILLYFIIQPYVVSAQKDSNIDVKILETIVDLQKKTNLLLEKTKNLNYEKQKILEIVNNLEQENDSLKKVIFKKDSVLLELKNKIDTITYSIKSITINYIDMKINEKNKEVLSLKEKIKNLDSLYSKKIFEEMEITKIFEEKIKLQENIITYIYKQYRQNIDENCIKNSIVNFNLARNVLNFHVINKSQKIIIKKSDKNKINSKYLNNGLWINFPAYEIFNLASDKKSMRISVYADYFSSDVTMSEKEYTLQENIQIINEPLKKSNYRVVISWVDSCENEQKHTLYFSLE